MRRLPSLLLLLLLLAACVPSLEDRSTRIDAVRLLAIRAVPAEAAPNQPVQLEVIAASPDGRLTTVPVRVALCQTRARPNELGSVSQSCLDSNSTDLVDVGAGSPVTATVPRDVCRRFGPNPGLPMPGEPAGRPADPDSTGGYFQPLIGFRTDDPSAESLIARVRVACGIANAPSALVSEFLARYRPNENPEVASLVVDDGTNELVAAPEPAENPVVRGAALALELAWPDCPRDGGVCGDGVCGDAESTSTCTEDCAAMAGCGGAESYVRFDAVRTRLVVEREAMRVAWYATSGRFDEPTTGVAADASEIHTRNRLVLSGDVASFVVVAVLHDDRGGVAVTSARFRVTP